MSTGANNLSNDYALFLPLIDNILSGSYNWGHFFQDTFFVSHFQPLPILVYLVNAVLTGWNVYYELIFIVILSILRIFLTYQILTNLYPKGIRYLMLPIIALLIFSTSQISSYEFGASAVPLGLTAFGFTLSVWGLVKYRGRLVGLIIMAIGGLIASWTAATGVIAWLIWLPGMVLLGYKKIRHFVIWLISALAINFPYIYFLLINRKPGTNASLHSLLDLRLIMNLLGRPFANGIGQSTVFIPLGEAAGWLGMILGLVGLVLIIINRKKLLVSAIPAMLFMAFGLLCAWQTSVFRVMIAPWYTNMVMPYWIGLIGLAYLLAASVGLRDEILRIPPWVNNRLRIIYPIVIMCVLTGFYLKTNLTYRDKSFYLVSRSPVSAACLRNYEWAPTYCEREVFGWTVNRVYLSDFGWLVQRYHLNVFSPRQTWTMQGDMILGNVFSPEAPNTLGVDWYDGFPGKLAVYSDYRHLNLGVTPSQSAVWNVQLPENLLSAEFVSAIGIGRSGQAGEALTFNVYIKLQGFDEQLVFSRTISDSANGWTKFRLDLLPYQGQKINVRLAVKSGNNSPSALYKYPHINLTLLTEEPLQARPDVRPINTDLSTQVPKPQPTDIIFNLKNIRPNGLVPINGPSGAWKVEQNPYFKFELDSPLELKDYGWVSFRLSASPDIPSRAAKVILYFDGENPPVELLIPLLADGGIYTYTYPLRMVPINGKLNALLLSPVLLPSAQGENIVVVEDVRLIHLP